MTCRRLSRSPKPRLSSFVALAAGLFHEPATSALHLPVCRAQPSNEVGWPPVSFDMATLQSLRQPVSASINHCQVSAVISAWSWQEEGVSRTGESLQGFLLFPNTTHSGTTFPEVCARSVGWSCERMASRCSPPLWTRLVWSSAREGDFGLRQL